MKFITRIAAIALIAFAAVGCSKVDPGNVGIRVANFGDRGVQGEVVLPGKYVWNGPGYQLYEYPVFKQTVAWTKKDGKAFTFQTSDGMSIGADVGMTYNVGQACVSKFFKEFRIPIDQVTDTFVRNNVRSAFNTYAASMKVDAVYGAGKVELLEKVKNQVKVELEPKCLFVDDIYLVSDFNLPPNVRGAINNKIQATQMAEQRQNEVAQAKAEAEKAVVTAQGEADARVAQAKAEAEAIRITGAALSENPELVDLKIAERWDGKLPEQYLGGGADGKILQIMRK